MLQHRKNYREKKLSYFIVKDNRDPNNPVDKDNNGLISIKEAYIKGYYLSWEVWKKEQTPEYWDNDDFGENCYI